MTICETPGQAALVAVGAGLTAGVVALAAGLGPLSTVGIAAGLAIAGELLGHWYRGDFAALRDRGGRGRETETATDAAARDAEPESAD